MRKLKLQVQISMDGFISGAQGEMDWMEFNWSQDIKDFVSNLTEEVDTILLGRNLAEGFIPHWTNSYNSETPEEGSGIFVNTPKVVFTKTMEDSIWANTILAKGDLVQEVNALKNLPGKDVIAYGGGKFVASLIKEKLIDELNLLVNPSAIGKGMPIFQLLTEMQNYQLITAKPFECGIVALTYKIK